MEISRKILEPTTKGQEWNGRFEIRRQSKAAPGALQPAQGPGAGKAGGAASLNRAEDGLPLQGKTTKSFGAKELNPHLDGTVKTNQNLNRDMKTWSFWKNTPGNLIQSWHEIMEVFETLDTSNRKHLSAEHTNQKKDLQVQRKYF